MVSHPMERAGLGARCYTADSKSLSDQGYPVFQSHSKEMANGFKGKTSEQEQRQNDDQECKFR